MRNILCLAAFLAISLFLSGCSVYTPLSVQLEPDSINKIEPSNDATIINLTVVDERDSTSIGLRGGMNMGGEITYQGNLSEHIKSAIQARLHAENFNTKATEKTGVAKLLVEIRSLHYKILTGVWSGTAHSENALKAICTSTTGSSYSKMYRGEHDKKGLQIVPGEREIPQLITESVTDSIEHLSSDQSLLDCLKN